MSKICYTAALLLVLAACGTKSPGITENRCEGRCGTVQGVVCPACSYGFTCNAAQYCVEITSDFDIQYPDYTGSTDAADTADTAPADEDRVLSEHDYPEMWDDPYTASYPDEDRNIAYIYYGDIDIVATDPENVRALWNNKYTGQQPAECTPFPFDACAGNYPHEPQLIENWEGAASGKCLETKNPFVAQNTCDYLLMPGCWRTGEIGDRLRFYEKNGKVLFTSGSNKTKNEWQSYGTYVYDMKTRAIVRYGREYYETALNNNVLFMTTSDLTKKLSSNPEYVVYYDLNKNQYGYAYKGEPFYGTSDVRASEKYVFLQAYFTTDGSGNDSRLLYTKTGEWDNWKELTYKKDTLQNLERRPFFPSMLDNLVAYADWNYDITLCDLDIGDAGCRKINRDDEYGWTPQIKNAHTLYYASTKKSSETQGNEIVIVEADISDLNNIIYKTIVSSGDKRTNVTDIDDKYLLYVKAPVYDPQAHQNSISHICYYRYKDGKTFCMKEAWDEKVFKLRAFFWKHWLVYETSWYVSQELVVRDMECYCDQYPDQCPFDDYTPKVKLSASRPACHAGSDVYYYNGES